VGGKNPQLTVCQLHTAMAVLVQSWWDNGHAASDRLVEKTVRKIQKLQQRNAQARKSHTKTTRRKLRALVLQQHFCPCQRGPRQLQ
jgi:hypothetical protein